jgi:hypothetical protein
VIDAVAGSRQSIEEPVCLGDPEASRPALSAIDESKVGVGTTLPAPLHLRIPGVGRPARVPGEWIGTNLYLVAPLAHCHDPQRSRASSASRAQLSEWTGPMYSALAALAAHCDVHGSIETRARAGARIANEVFADSLCILDATWWAAAATERRARPRPRGGLSPEPTRRLASELIAPEHCLATPAIQNLEAASAVDAWLASLLGIQAINAGQSTPRVLGKRTPWPETHLPTVSLEAEGLAGRAVEALWGRATRIAGFGGPEARLRKRTRRSGEGGRAAISPRIPGRFSSAWDRETKISPADSSR